MKFRITYKKSDLTAILKAANRVVLRANIQAEKIPSVSAAEYVAAIRKAISFKKYNIIYNKKYRDWKVKNVGHLKSRVLGGDLVDNLDRTKLSKGVYLGGVKAGIFDSGGKSWYSDINKGKKYGAPKEIAMYGRAVEAIHPLFVPEMEKYKRRWLIKVNKAKRHIMSTWKKWGSI